tara:strand:+ start:800 stop:1195 length:396 start_codon:yes stop_codon:yes gene_type:complete
MFDCLALRFVYETHDSSACARPSGSPAAVDISLSVFRGVEVKDTLDIVNVYATSSYVCRNQNKCFTFSKMPQGTISLTLRARTVNYSCLQTLASKLLSGTVRSMPSACKNDCFSLSSYEVASNFDSLTSVN